MKWICLVFLLVAMTFIISGCASLPIKPNVPTALTPQQQLTQMVSGTNWVVTLMLFGVGAGFFAFLNGNSKGLQAMAACFVVLSLALGIARFSLIISAITMIGAVCLMGYTVLVKNKALKEVVSGVQKFRDDMTTNTDGLDKMIADQMIAIKKAMSAMLASEQSKSTEQIVKQTKAAL